MEKKTILVVDDNKTVLSLAETVLTEHGYNVKLADSGAKALDMYRDWGEFIDLVLLDLSMPGLNGDETMQQLISIDKNVKVIIVSGYAESVSRLGSMSKAKNFIKKPYDVSELTYEINVAMAV